MIPDSLDSPALPDAAPAVQPKISRRWLPLVRSGVIVVAIALAILEIVLRLMGLTRPILYERDPDAGYRLKPNQRVSYFGNEVTVNALGVRDSRTFDGRNPDKKRVVCLGDSVTWGGIYERQENLFTSVAENKLGNVEVINAGVNGYSVTQMVRLYENHLTTLAPDLVVFCVIARDFERPRSAELTGNGVGFPIEPPRIAIVEALKLCHQAVYNRLRWDWLRPPPAAVPVRTPSGVIESMHTRAIIEFARSLPEEVRIAVVFLPIGFGNVDRNVRRDCARDLRANNVWTVDLNGTVELRREDFVDRVHLSTSGHRKVGAALASVIYDELSPERPKHNEPVPGERIRRDR